MELPLPRAADCEVRSTIRFLCALGIETADIHRDIVTVYGEGVMSIQMVRRWVKSFQEGREEVHDMQRSGRPSDTINENSITAVRAILNENRRISVRVIQRILQEEHFLEVSLGSLHTILHGELEMRKICARWVPKQLTEEHKKNRMGAGLEFLTRYQEEGEPLFDRIVTGDESWIHYYTPETKRQSMQWVSPGKKAPKKFKTVPSAGKVLLTVFWDAQGILLEEYMEKGKTINSASYQETLKNLRRAIQNKRRGKLSEKVLLIHDNARPHTANATQNLLKKLNWEIFPHPPHSPDLAPSDYYLFSHLKVEFGGERFENATDLKNAVSSYFEKLAATHYHAGIEKLLYRYNKCLELNGDYVEK